MSPAASHTLAAKAALLRAERAVGGPALPAKRQIAVEALRTVLAETAKALAALAAEAPAAEGYDFNPSEEAAESLVAIDQPADQPADLPADLPPGPTLFRVVDPEGAPCTLRHPSFRLQRADPSEPLRLARAH